MGDWRSVDEHGFGVGCYAVGNIGGVIDVFGGMRAITVEAMEVEHEAQLPSYSNFKWVYLGRYDIQIAITISFTYYSQR